MKDALNLPEFKYIWKLFTLLKLLIKNVFGQPETGYLVTYRVLKTGKCQLSLGSVILFLKVC